MSGVAQRQRRHSRFCLDALVIIEVNIPINQFIRFLDRLWFVAVDALRFQNIIGIHILITCLVSSARKLMPLAQAYSRLGYRK